MQLILRRLLPEKKWKAFFSSLIVCFFLDSHVSVAGASGSDCDRRCQRRTDPFKVIQSISAEIDDQLSEGTELVNQARKIMNLSWASCVASEAQIKLNSKNRDYGGLFWRAEPSLQQDKSCQMANKIDKPKYNFGGRPDFSDEQVNFFDTRGYKFRADCSSFIAGAMHLQGLRFVKPGAPYHKEPVFATVALINLPNFEGTCFKSVDLRNGAISPGDLFVSRRSGRGHVVMIDSIEDADDPFGLSNEKSCVASKISSEDFKFNIIHSGASPRYIAPSRMSAAAFCKYNRPTCYNLKLIAERACKIKRGLASENDWPVRRGGIKANLIRHSYKEDDACRDDKKSLKYGECLDQCEDTR